MRTIFKTAIYATAAVMLATACDTTEEAFYPGTSAGILPLEITPKGDIKIDASGTRVVRNVQANAPWTVKKVRDEYNSYTLTGTSGEGDGEFSISASTNYNSSDQREGKIAIVNEATGDSVSIDVYQSKLQFIVPDNLQDLFDDKLPETGGSVSFDLTITIPWIYKTDDDTSWLQFTPAASADGIFDAQWQEFTVTIEALPNYTGEERTVSLQVYPSDSGPLENLEEQGLIKSAFTITQEAGTLPTNVSGDTLSVSKTDVSYRLSYESKSPVRECGVRVLNGSGEVLTTVAAERSGNGYPQSDSANVNVTGLEEGQRYTFEPYVVNMVGETAGEPISVTMKSDAVEYYGVTISSYEIVTTEHSVTAKVTVESDTDVYEVGMSIYNEMYQDSPLVTYTQPTSGTAFTVEVSSTDIMNPNSEGQVVIFARTSVNEAQTERITFRTKSLTPDEGDLNTPDIN